MTQRLSYILAFVLCLFTIPLHAQTTEGIQFFQGNFEEALKEAKAQKKPLFVDFYASWCMPCKKMSKNVFTQKEVGEYFNAKFISLKVDAEKPENASVAKKYKVEAFPTLAIIAPEGKPISINVGALDAKALIEMGKTAVGELLGFEQLYDLYKSNPENLNTQQELLLQTPRFLAAQDGMDAEKWVVRMRKLYHNYVEKKMADNSLINRQDYIIITTLGGDDPKETDKMINYINAHLLQWKSVIGETAAYYVIEKNDQQIEELAKAGDKSYQNYLERIRSDYKEAYSVLKSGQLTPYEKAKAYYDALYTIYKDKDVAQYIQLMNKYLTQLGNTAEATDYGKAAQWLYYAAGSKLTEQNHHQAIVWLELALRGQMNLMDKINYLVMTGDSYKELRNTYKARLYYNQAYAESLQMSQMEQVQQMLQASIQHKLATLDLLLEQ